MKKIINLLVGINITLVSFMLGFFDKIYQKKIIKKLKQILGNDINKFLMLVLTKVNLQI